MHFVSDWSVFIGNGVRAMGYVFAPQREFLINEHTRIALPAIAGTVLRRACAGFTGVSSRIYVHRCRVRTPG